MKITDISTVVINAQMRNWVSPDYLSLVTYA
jgi:hypothetical protein